MDFLFLPDKARQTVLAQENGNEPLCSIRGSGAFNSKPGESYLLVYADKVYLLERGFGGGDYNFDIMDFSSIKDISLQKEHFSLLLKLIYGDEEFCIKLSCAEEDNAGTLLKVAGEYAPEAAVPATEMNDPGELSLTGKLIVGMVYIAAGDGEVSELEQRAMLKVCSGNTQLYNAAVDYYHNHDFQQFLDGLSLDSQQSLCFYANMLETAMTDGVLKSEEQQMLRDFGRHMNIDADAIAKIWDVLLIKNQLSVLE
ncbi:MAG: TerB family tellurite resistance protein [Victivallales bacterium]|nr:TerB family tellurite resistance protein [Victivallales bacterium]